MNNSSSSVADLFQKYINIHYHTKHESCHELQRVVMTEMMFIISAHWFTCLTHRPTCLAMIFKLIKQSVIPTKRGYFST